VQDTAKVAAVDAIGAHYLSDAPYVKVGDSFMATTELGTTHFYYNFVFGPTPHGINFEQNNLDAEPVNGFPLSDTYIVVGFDSLWPGPNIGGAELLALNHATITYQESSLSFDFSPNYKYVDFDITRIVVAPEPTALFLLIAAVPGIQAVRRPARLRS
jgi:hypothetical protein